jgi:RNA polymerase sigma factor (sigma-70 family)
MITVQNYVGSFVPDQRRARFRTWLRKIVQSRIADQHRKRKRDPLEKAVDKGQRPEEDSATSMTNRLADPNAVELDRLVDGKLEQAVLAEARRLAKQEVRIEQYQAYDLFRFQELSAAEVAISLGISAVTVRVWAFRVGRVVSRQARRLARMLENPRHCA